MIFLRRSAGTFLAALIGMSVASNAQEIRRARSAGVARR